MIKYNEENKEYICLYCSGSLEEYNSKDIKIKIYRCINCKIDMNSNGEEITDWEEYLIEKCDWI